MAVRLSRESPAPQPTDLADNQPEAASESSSQLDARVLRCRVRPRGWRPPVTDGPFAESKEMLGG
jgi:hypothetical protein